MSKAEKKRLLSKAKPYDVIAVRTRGILGFIIRVFEWRPKRSTFSNHTAIVDTSRKHMYEALMTGFQRSSMDKLMSRQYEFRIYRYIGHLAVAQKTTMDTFLRAYEGRGYDWAMAIYFPLLKIGIPPPLLRWADARNLFWCSEGVAAVYGHVGIHLNKRRCDNVWPAAFERSALFSRVK